MLTKISALKYIVFCFGAAVSMAILLGFSGTRFPIGDSAAVIRPQASILLLILAVSFWVLKARRAACLATLLASYALVSVLPFATNSTKTCNAACLTLYQKNLLSRAWPRYTLADDIVSSGAEIVTLQEVSNHNRKFMTRMFEHFQTMLTCNFRPGQQVAVLTSLPAIKGSKHCLPGAGLAAMQVEAPNGTLIWVVSIHLPWPYPHDQHRQSQTIAGWLAKLQPPVLIAGDFNMVPWGASVQRIAAATGNRRLGNFQSTYRSGNFLLPLPIDSVLVPHDMSGSIEYRPYLGSDHLGILSQIAIP